MGILQRRYSRKMADERAERRAEEVARRMREIEAMARDFLTTEQVATLVGVSVGTLRRWRSAGTGPEWVKFGGSKQSKCRYPRATLWRYLDDPRSCRPTAGRLDPDGTTPPPPSRGAG